MVIKLYLLIVLSVVVPIWLWVRGNKYIKNKKNFNFFRELIVNVFFVYMLAVAYLTLKPFHFNIPLLGGRSNFSFDVNLFYNLRNMAATYSKYQLLYSIGNIMMLVPFGLFMPMLFKYARHFISILLLGFTLSLTIELTQTFFTMNRSGTVDDLFFNTLG